MVAAAVKVETLKAVMSSSEKEILARILVGVIVGMVAGLVWMVMKWL